MEAAAQSISRLFARLGDMIAALVVGVLAGGSVLALGTKAVVLVPALACAFAMIVIPYSPLYAIVVTIPVNVEIAGPITVSRLAIVFGVFVAIIQGVKGQTPKLHIPWPEGGLALCFFLWIVFSTVAASQGSLVARLGTYFIYAVIFFMVLIYVDTFDRAKSVMWALVCVGVFQGLLVAAETLVGFSPFGGIHAELAEGLEDNQVRVAGATAHPIVLASFFQSVIAIAVYFLATAKTNTARVMMLGVIGLFFYGWVNAWARSSWIGMAAMIFLAMMIWSRTTRILAVVGGILGFIILAAHDFSPGAVIETVDSLKAVQSGSFRAGVSQSSESFSWRTENWMAALSIGAEYPIFGVGVDRVHLYVLNHLPEGAIAHRFIQPAIPHNMFLQTLAETGIPGMILFLALWFSAFAALLRAWAHDDLRPMAFAFVIVMCGEIVTYFFNPMPRSIWFTLAMAFVLGRIARTRDQNAPNTGPAFSATPKT